MIAPDGHDSLIAHLARAERFWFFQEDGSGHFCKLEDFPAQQRVPNLAVDSETHQVYAPEQPENARRPGWPSRNL